MCDPLILQGVMSRRKLPLPSAGLVFGHLTTIDQYGYSVGKLMSRVHAPKQRLWLTVKCLCKCGSTKFYKWDTLKRGDIQSCGCISYELKAKIHRGKTKFTNGFGCKSTLYNVWSSMRARCGNPSHKAYKNYGARGIQVCSEWDDFDNFASWAIKSGYQPNQTTDRKKDLTLDRINNNENYTPDNCRWTNWKVQANNRRKTSRTRD